MRAIWWIKRDFRLRDNVALCNALADQDEILPVFIFEQGLIDQADTSPMHVWAWQQALGDLRKNLQKLGGDIWLATGDILECLDILRRHYNFDTIYSHEETGIGWTYERDKAVAKWCKKCDIIWHEYPQNGVIRGLSDRDKRQAIIKKRLLHDDPLPAPKNIKFPTALRPYCERLVIPAWDHFFDSKAYPYIAWDDLQNISETAAWQDFDSFLGARGYGYSGGISSPNTAFHNGSRLSVHLAWGTISLRSVFHATFLTRAYHKNNDDLMGYASNRSKKWERSLRAFSSRLHWHDHFIQRLESAPYMEFQALNPAYDAIEYEDDDAKLEAWKYGRTGFPIIDACMRCLQATGFLNFRMRAMVVSFACFGLHLSWKTIHPHLAQIFLDFEPGIHISQLQMQAGVVGINTIRVYSPTKQILDQDPDCIFIKKWVPELSEFSAQEITQYEHIILGDYPAMIVDFKASSRVMKEQIFAIRRSMKGKEESQKILERHGSRKRSNARRRNASAGMSKKQGIRDNRQADLFSDNL